MLARGSPVGVIRDENELRGTDCLDLVELVERELGRIDEQIPFLAVEIIAVQADPWALLFANQVQHISSELHCLVKRGLTARPSHIGG